MEGQTAKIEGILPSDLWIFFYVLFALIALFVLVGKAINIIREWRKDKKDAKDLGDQDITVRIAEKVTENLMPQIDEKFSTMQTEINRKFADIDGKLQNDKETLDMHTRQLNEHEGRVGRLEGGNKSLCQGILALLEVNPALSTAQKAMKNYLVNGTYNEEDWK